MEDIELKNIWREYDRKIEEAKILNLQSWVLNLQSFEYMQTQKAKSKLNALSNFKKWAIVLGMIWIFFLGVLFVNSLSFPKIFFAASVGIILLFNLFAVMVYIKHTLIINEIDNSESLLETQKKIGELQVSTLRSTRILFLQTPFYSTFFWSLHWISNSPESFWLIAFPITLLLTLLTVWLYRSLTFKKVNKKWVKILLGGKEWMSITKALDVLNEINEYKNELG